MCRGEGEEGEGGGGITWGEGWGGLWHNAPCYAITPPPGNKNNPLLEVNIRIRNIRQK